MPIHKIQRELRANKPKLICSALHCAVWEIIVIKAFNCNTLLTFSALPKVKLNAMLFLYCLWCQYYACWTNKHNLWNIKMLMSKFTEINGGWYIHSDCRKPPWQISSQQAILEKYAQEDGFKNTRVFIDDGWSGTNYARPAFTEIMELAEKGHIGT